jgi:DNA (cytosine-5)-methyltransferase 1
MGTVVAGRKAARKLAPRLNSFFAGIGGFDLGFQRAGIEPAFHCEIHRFCASVLRRHWSKVPLTADIRTVTPNDIPEVEVWCGGFPCQDVSVARGSRGRDGLGGKNSGLFYPFAELVKAKSPTVVLMENVTGLLNSHRGHDFSVVLRTFCDMGYGVAWRVLNTRYFGSPQSRPRVYICAWLESGLSAMTSLFEEGVTHRPANERRGFLQPTLCPKTGAKVPETAFCLAATSGRHTGTDWSRSYVAYEDEVRRLTPTECERLQGFPEGWTLPGDDYHLSVEDIDTLRYHAIGNAVSVPVVEWVAQRIRTQLLASSAERKPDPNPWETLRDAIRKVPDFTQKKACIVALPPIDSDAVTEAMKWSTGGIMVAGRCVMAPVSSAPASPMPSLFVNSLDPVRPDRRYFLSSNAARGIIRRVTNQERELFGPLAAALKRLADSESEPHPTPKATRPANLKRESA